MKLTERFNRSLLLAVAVAALFSGIVSTASAQGLSVKIRLLPDSRRAEIEATCLPTTVWSFHDSYAGIVGLGRRVEHFRAFDEDHKEISVRESAPGQFESLKPAQHFQYALNLVPPQRAADCPMVSWLDKETGLLLLFDLLPAVTSASALKAHPKLHLELPAAWTVQSSEAEVAPNEFEIEDVGRAVFAVGANLRAFKVGESGMRLNFVSGGDWSFNDADVIDLTRKVLKAHYDTFGAIPGKTATFILLPFPIVVGASQWSAETRGATVTLLMGKLPSKIAALAQLSTPVTHEFFHLWIPNALTLEGDYDWFYEGFTIYEASQTGVKLGLLTFPEFLSSIARAYDSSKNQTDLSLVEASKRRFTGGLMSVYSKAQVVAFIYDLRLRYLSRNRKSLSDVYRKLMSAAKLDSAPGKTRDGNQAVTNALSKEIGSDECERQFIRNPVSISLASELAPFGLKVDVAGLRTQISVSEKLSKQQRDLLRELGYNAATHATR